jgi:hypothetical protein
MIAKRAFFGNVSSAAIALTVGAAIGCGGSVTSAPPPGDDAGPGIDSGHVTSSLPDAAADTSTAPDSSVANPTDAEPDTSLLQGRVPLNHRPNDAQCLQPPSGGTCSHPETDASYFICAENSQCTKGTNGRCQDGLAALCWCAYDTCTDDSACSTGEVCACHGSPYADGAGNTCVPGNCRVDADCGPAGYCSPAHGTGNCGDVTGYYCHTPSDTCIDDTDCSNNGETACTWSSASSNWTCQEIIECP